MNQVREASEEKAPQANVYSSRFLMTQAGNTIAQENTDYVKMMRNYQN